MQEIKIRKEYSQEKVSKNRNKVQRWSEKKWFINLLAKKQVVKALFGYLMAIKVKGLGKDVNREAE